MKFGVQYQRLSLLIACVLSLFAVIATAIIHVNPWVFGGSIGVFVLFVLLFAATEAMR